MSGLGLAITVVKKELRKGTCTLAEVATDMELWSSVKLLRSFEEENVLLKVPGSLKDFVSTASSVASRRDLKLTPAIESTQQDPGGGLV